MFLPNIILMLASFGSIFTAPADGPERIGLPLVGSDRVIESATGKLSTLRDAAYQNAMVVNQLVSSNLATVGQTLDTGYNSISNTLSTGYSAVSDGINSGISTASEVIGGHLETAGNIVTRQIDSASELASKGLTVVKSAIYDVPDGGPINKELAIAKSIAAKKEAILPAIGIFSERPKKLNTAILEQEDFSSRSKSFTENIGAFFAGIFQPKPIVDTIQEEEKYGNTGERFAPLAKAIVGGTESISSWISNAINIPFDTFKEITRSASSKLNNFGGRLIGL